MLNCTSIENLRLRYPWPPEQPNVLSTDWSLDGGGKELVINKIRSAKLECIVEMGVFFGGSVRKWVTNTANTIVIAVDPWEPAEWWSEYATNNGHGELAAQLSEPQGPFETFLASTWDLRERVIPVNRPSLSILHELSEIGVIPDLIFLDNDKTGNELDVAHELFPAAVLTGDDWTWGKDEDYPIQKSVKAFCLKHNYTYRHRDCTWVIDFEPIPVRERMASTVSLMNKKFRSLARRAINICRFFAGR